VTPTLRELASGTRSLLGIASRRWVFGGPRTVALGVANVCNTRCAMCWSHSPLLPQSLSRADHPGPAFMDSELFESIIRQCREIGTYRVVLGGDGDPALHPDLDRVLVLMTALGMEPFVMTNGLALDDHRIELWAGLRAHYRFSVHAGDPETWARVHDDGSGKKFERLSRTIRAIVEAGTARVSTMHVLHRHNFRGVRAMVEHAHSLGVGEILFRPARVDETSALAEVALDSAQEARLHVELGRCLEMAEAFGISTNLRDYLATNLYIRRGRLDTRDLYRKIPCYVSWMYAEFAIDGAMTPCIHSSRVMAHADRETITSAWRSQRYNDLRGECRQMPRTGHTVAGCRCEACCMAKYNLNLHNMLRLRSLRFSDA